MAGASRRSSRAQSEWNVEPDLPAILAEQLFHALAHFLGRFVRERHREHLAGVRVRQR